MLNYPYICELKKNVDITCPMRSFTSGRYLVVVLVVVFLSACPAPLWANPAKDAYTEVRLIPEETSIQPGRPFWVGVRMKMDDGWHVYWKNAGDSGLSMNLDWQLPEGFQAGEIQWPYPKLIRYEQLVSYGYEDEVLFLTEITPSASLPAEEVPLAVDVDWLACKIQCVPGHVALSTSLPVNGVEPKKDQLWQYLFESTRNKLPLEKGEWNLSAVSAGDSYVIRLIPRSAMLGFVQEAIFFPEREDIIDHAASQRSGWNLPYFEIKINKSSLRPQSVDRLKGVVYTPQAWDTLGKHKAMEVDIPLAVERKAEEKNVLPVAPSTDPVAVEQEKEEAALPRSGSAYLGLVILFAFLGGLILNLMPCVLPVLSLKILNFIQHAQEEEIPAWRHGLSFSFGVLAAFWALAVSLLLMRQWGAQVGWGFQFQSPVFLVTLTLIFFLLALNLFGFFEIGTSLAAAGYRGKPPSGLAGSFSSGILVTIAATPCTAPFMGTAIGVAVTQPWPVALMIFTSLGLGMACPFLALSVFPQALRYVPRPGPWMIYLKRFFGLVLLAVVFWLMGIFHLQKGFAAVAVLSLGFVLIGLSLAASRRLGKFAAFLIACGIMAVFISTQLPGKAVPREEMTGHSASQIQWQPYSPEFVADLHQQRRPFFIDFTAAWCLSCRVNEKVALQAPRVIKRFKEMGVVAVKADWTSQDKRITQALAGYGKNSIPLYVLYGSGRDREPVILPEIITPAIVLDALEQIEKKN